MRNVEIYFVLCRVGGGGVVEKGKEASENALFTIF